MSLRFLISFLFVLVAIVANAQELADELYEMDLAELMDIRVKRISLPDVPHTHTKNELMLAYHFMKMKMGGNYDGSEQLSSSSVLERYMVTPTSMQMDMHMLHAMYAPSNKLTLMLMANYIKKEMDHEMRNDMTFITESSGVSDVQLAGLYSFWTKDINRITALVGVSVPLGSIQEKGVTPMSVPNEMPLPYPMQIGSGTWDPLVGLTYIKAGLYAGWGVDVRELVRLGENYNDYRLGNEFKATFWYSRTFSDHFSTSLQLLYSSLGNIRGKDSTLNPMMVYTADPNLRAGQFLKGGLVLTYHPIDILKGIRFSGEMKYPIYQKLDGPQLGVQHEYKFAVAYVL